MLALTLLLVLGASPLTEAAAHLKDGKFEELLFDLEGNAQSESDRPKAAHLLAQAAQGALTAKDALLALQLAQMALQRIPEHADALGVAAKAYLMQQEFAASEAMADRWILSARTLVDARLFRAELALEQAEWRTALVLVQSLVKPTSEEKRRAAVIKQRATAELSEHALGRAELQRIEGSVKQASETMRAEELAEAAKVPPNVVIYGAEWCGPCRGARHYLKGTGIPFKYVDIDLDQTGAAEAKRLRGEKRLSGGIPLIRVGADAMVGFNQECLAEMLSRL